MISCPPLRLPTISFGQLSIADWSG
jgi:hypothetical protein